MNKRLVVLFLALMPVCTFAMLDSNGLGEVRQLGQGEFSCSKKCEGVITTVFRYADGRIGSNAVELCDGEFFLHCPRAYVVNQLKQKIAAHIYPLPKPVGESVVQKNAENVEVARVVEAGEVAVGEIAEEVKE